MYHVNTRFGRRQTEGAAVLSGRQLSGPGVPGGVPAFGGSGNYCGVNLPQDEVSLI